MPILLFSAYLLFNQFIFHILPHPKLHFFHFLNLLGKGVPPLFLQQFLDGGIGEKREFSRLEECLLWEQEVRMVETYPSNVILKSFLGRRRPGRIAFWGLYRSLGGSISATRPHHSSAIQTPNPAGYYKRLNEYLHGRSYSHVHKSSQRTEATLHSNHQNSAH